ncbi:hypothetical protein GBA52_014747 [Prunus armeniaca]|nr:hypothetical protein GBA52_014747 [Prunus armeniaca]
MFLVTSGFCCEVRGITSLNGAWGFNQATWPFNHSFFRPCLLRPSASAFKTVVARPRGFYLCSFSFALRRAKCLTKQ